VVPFPAADTLGTMTEQVISSLLGWDGLGEQHTTLVSPLTTSTTSSEVVDADTVSRGVIEIDGELMYVDGCSATTVALTPWGRGYRGTTAAVHAAGAKVVVNPVFPSSVAARAINEEISAVYPALFAVKTTAPFLYDWSTYEYELPADCVRVLAVRSQRSGFDEWDDLAKWAVKHSVPTTVFTTGKVVVLTSGIGSGELVQVVYAARPTALTAAADVFTTVTGLPASAKDVIVMGAQLRLLPSLDYLRLPTRTAEADAMSNARQGGLAVSIAGKLRETYAQRLLEERTALYDQYPVIPHNINCRSGWWH
jgi:hypothetical protein